MPEYCKERCAPLFGCNLPKGHKGPHRSSVTNWTYKEDKHGHYIEGSMKHRDMERTWRRNADGTIKILNDYDGPWIEADGKEKTDA